MQHATRSAALAAAFLALISAAILFACAWRAPFNVLDEGYLYYIGWQVGRGAVPFRDIELFTYAPGLFYLWAGWFELVGLDIVAARGLSVLLGVANVLLAWRVAVVLGMRPLPALLVGLVELVCYPDIIRGHLLIVTLAGMLAVLHLCAADGRRSRALLMLCGLIVALGLAVRIDAALTVLAAVMTALVTRWMRHRRLAGLASDMLVFVASLVVAMGLLFAVFALAGVAQGWRDQLLGFVGFAANRSVAWYKLPFPWFEGGLGSDLTTVLMLGCVAITVGTMVAALLAWRAGDAHRRSALAVLAVFAVMNLPQFLIERPDRAHLGDHIYVFVLAAAGLIVFRGLWPARFRPVVTFGIALWVGLVLVWIPPKEGTMLGNGLAAHRDVLVEGRRVPMEVGPRTDLFEATQRLTRGERRLGAVPFMPGYNFLLRMPLPSRQVVFDPYTVARPASVQEFVKGLSSPELDHLVLAPDFGLGGYGSRLVCYAPRVARFIERNFSVEAETAAGQLLRKGGTMRLARGGCTR